MTDANGTSAITDIGRELPADAAPPFDAVGVGRRLLRAIRAGALATNDPGGFPLATLVNVATDIDGAPLLLVSGLSLHTRNLVADGRAALLLAETGKGDPLAHPRLTLVGACRVTADERVRRRFLSRHPKSQLYVGLPDFTFWRMEVAAVHLNGGFARAARLAPADLLTGIADAADLVAAEAGAVAHMNEDHADAVALYATRLLGAPAGPWRLTGLDPDGADLMLGDAALRLPFPARVTTAAALRQVLGDLAKQARASASDR